MLLHCAASELFASDVTLFEPPDDVCRQTPLESAPVIAFVCDRRCVERSLRQFAAVELPPLRYPFPVVTALPESLIRPSCQGAMRGETHDEKCVPLSALAGFRASRFAFLHAPLDFQRLDAVFLNEANFIRLHPFTELQPWNLHEFQLSIPSGKMSYSPPAMDSSLLFTSYSTVGRFFAFVPILMSDSPSLNRCR